MAGLRATPATPLDLVYLRNPTSTNPWVPAFGINLAAATDPRQVRLALVDAGLAHPRFMSRYESGYWVARARAGDLDVATDDDRDRLTRHVVDRAFDDTDRASVRAGVSDDGRFLIVAWRHAACDAAGGVAFCARLLRSLDRDPAAYAPEPDTTAVREMMRREARTFAARRAFVDKALARGGAGPAAAFPEIGPIGATSATVSWTVSDAQRRAIASAARRGGASFTGYCAAALAGAADECLPDGHAPIQMLVPVNLRPAESRWAPDGNWVGNAELRFERLPTPVEATAAVTDATRSAARAVPVVAAAVRARMPWLERDDPDRRLGRTIVLNNLGSVAPAEWPGVTDAAFFGPTGADLPAVTLFSVGGTLCVCVRVRDHQGGAPLAAALCDAFRGRLLADR